jgi:flagellum-specific peptidoglycan hydrolase FlgJ
MFRRIALMTTVVVALAGCGSSDSDDADTTEAAAVATDAAGDEAAAEPTADDPNDGVISESEWAVAQQNLADGGVTRPTYEIVVAAATGVCAAVETTSVTTTSEFVAEMAPAVTALAPDAGLDSTDIGAIVGTIATYACADAFTVLTNA